MNELLQDVRYALRMLRKAPAFTAAALLVIALGIGATSAIFSVVDAVVLRPLPYPESGRLAVIHTDFHVPGLEQLPASLPEFRDFRAGSRSFEALAAYKVLDGNLGEVEPPERLRVAHVSPSFFPVLRLDPARGRAFTPDEERPGSDRVVVLSHALWRRRFGGDLGAVGRKITIDGEAYEVVGVMPPGFSLPQKADVWVPVAPTPEELSEARRNYRNWEILGRLKEGVSPADASADLTALRRRVLEELQGAKDTSPTTVHVRPLKDVMVGETRTTLLVLLGAVAFVLLIACANVANLLLARTTVRQREIAVRAALGASTGRLAVQFLIESVVLALLGGGLGLLLALWGVDALVAIGPDRLPRADEVHLDAAVVAFTAGVSLLTGLVFGVVPALHASRVDPAEVLKEGSRGTAGGRIGRFRDALVVTQVALALVLLAGAGLMTRSLAARAAAPLGFEPRGVLTGKVALTSLRYGDDAPKRDFMRALLERVRALPGVRAAGVVSQLPISERNTQSFRIEGRALGDDESWPYAIYRVASPGYFAAMGVPLLEGRLIGEQDGASAPLVAVVNQALAKRYFPEGNAVGSRIRAPCPDEAKCPWKTIVGVVGDMREVATEEAPAPAFYPSIAQSPSTSFAVVIRGERDPEALLGPLGGEIRAIDRDQPIYDAATMDQRVEDLLGPHRFALEVLAIFALTALVLAAVGLYGVTSYMVAQRTREIGIRIALGARARDVIDMVVGKGMVLAGIGVAIGLLAALALGQVMASVVYGVSARDPLTLAVAAPTLLGAALLASFLPARRATRVPPAIALRAE